MSVEKIPDHLLAPGIALRYSYQADNVRSCVRHIRAVIDGDYVVYWVWSIRRRRVYKVEHRYGFDYAWTQGHIVSHKKDKGN